MLESIKAIDNWVAWIRVMRGEKATKVPYQPLRPKYRACAGAPNTWGSFAQACDLLCVKKDGEPVYNGVGFQLYASNERIYDTSHPVGSEKRTWRETTALERQQLAKHVTTKDGLFLIAVDLDHCIFNGNLTAFAQEVVDTIGSYWEISPSGVGLRGLVYGDFITSDNRAGSTIEMYCSGRYVTITGKRLGYNNITADVIANPVGVHTIHERYLKRDRPEKNGGLPTFQIPNSDEALLARIYISKDGDRFAKVYRYGIIHGLNFRVPPQFANGGEDGDRSTAEFYVLCKLAWWTRGDAERMRRLLLASEALRTGQEKDKDKWRTHPSYLDTSIEQAIATLDFGPGDRV